MTPLVAVLGFVTAAAATPGPNNLIVMAAAARGGLAAALPAIAGTVAGSLALLLCAWLGIGAAVAAAPRLGAAVTLSGALYLIGLGVALMRQAGRDDGRGHPRPVRALPHTAAGLAGFQFLNPKSWVMVVTATAALSAGGDGLASLIALAVIFAAVPSLCLTLWALAGAAIGERLAGTGAERRLARAMGALVIASAALLFV